MRALLTTGLGAGEVLVAGGEFASVTGIPADFVAQWDGASWSELGELPFPVHALAMFDDGTGAKLYAGGTSSRKYADAQGRNGIAVFEAGQWHPVGGGIDISEDPARISAFAVFDDGRGPALYAAGEFTSVGGVQATNVARWDGVAWEPLGDGLDREVHALIAFDDGSGAALYAGGGFHNSGTVDANHIARWNGSAWAEVGEAGLDGPGDAVVRTLAAFDSGAGPELYAAGHITTISYFFPSSAAVRWDGTEWHSLGAHSLDRVWKLHVHDDGTGPVLLAAGGFGPSTPSGDDLTSLARWDGANWVAISEPLGGLSASVGALATYGGSVWSGGSFLTSGTPPAANLGFLAGSQWQAIGDGFAGWVTALEVHDDGDGPSLFVGGGTWAPPGQPNQAILEWDGTTWKGLVAADQCASVHDFEAFDDGSGPVLFAAGQFATSDLATWDGQTWQDFTPEPPLSGALGQYRMLAFDDGSGPALFLSLRHIALGQGQVWRWRGSGPWTWVGTFDGPITDLVAYDDGQGARLYAVGWFTGRLARWDGATWTSLASGFGGRPSCATVHEGGLYVGGNFGVARWTGSRFRAIGAPALHSVRTLHSGRHAGAPALFAGGDFVSSGGVEFHRVARLEGQAWVPLGQGVGGSLVGLGAQRAVNAFATFDDGNGEALFVGGSFSIAFDTGDSFLAKWGCAALPVALSGCRANSDALSASVHGTVHGDRLAFELAADAPDGWSVLFAGSPRDSACSVPWPGVGEWLLADAPAPVIVARASVEYGLARFELTAPRSPALAGLTLAFQAATFAPGRASLSDALRVELSK